MGRTPILTDSEIQAALGKLPGWSVQNGKLHRDYAFPDFVHAFGFMATAAIAIEAMNHHPEWSNVWNRVSIDLVTHDSGGITAKDVELAAKLESLAARLL
jgi:4a-hydroxytetrahydrobiopterin dehydratase